MKNNFKELKFFDFLENNMDFEQLFENGNLLDDLNNVFDGSEVNSLTSESQSEISRSDHNIQKFVTCNVCKNHIDLGKVKDHSLRDSK